MKNKKISISIALIILTCIPLFYSFIKIIKWNIDNKKTKDNVQNIIETTKVEEITDSIYTNIITESEVTENKFLQVDFTNLRMKNSDTAGWINIPGTNIDYPFVQTNNNNYYLFHSFDKSWNDAGWVFLDYRNNINELDTNTIIYGHGRIDGTMFGSLKNTSSKEWLNDKDKQIVKISSLSYNYLFEVFSIYTIKTTNDYLYNNFGDSETYQNFIETIKKRSLHNFNVDVTRKDKIITLSTCYNNTEKYVLHAKLVKQQKRF